MGMWRSCAAGRMNSLWLRPLDGPVTVVGASVAVMVNCQWSQWDPLYEGDGGSDDP